MPFFTAYKLFSALLWQAEQHLQQKEFYALSLTVHVLAEIAMEEFTARKLAHDKALARRWDAIWFAHLHKPESQEPPPVALAESLIQEAETFLDAGDFVSARSVLPKLALLETVHGVGSVFPGDLADRVDVLRFGLKDHRG